MPSISRHLQLLSQYQRIVLGLYIVITPVLFAVFPAWFNFDLSLEDIVPAALVAIGTMALAIVCLAFRRDVPKAEAIDAQGSILAAILIAVFIALPEEIIFRGVIQQTFQNYFQTPWLAIALAALIFGGAHLANKARGVSPRKWNWKLAGLAALAGIPLGIVFVATGSLFFPILFHTLLTLGSKYFAG